MKLEMNNKKFIGVKECVNTFVLEKKFRVEKVVSAVLRITALGLYYAELNGERVGDAYLTPGFTSYHNRLQVQEYEVELKAGENVLALTVNNGWYCGRFPFEWGNHTYGEQSAVWAELDCIDGKIVTDKSWTARESFIRKSEIYDGETQDFTAECKILTPIEVPCDTSVLIPQMCEAVRNIERVSVKEIIRTPQGELVYDFGQNLTGVVEIKIPKEFSGTLTMQFAEILVHGNFYTANLRSAKATDTFTVNGAKTLCPEFTFHGFRYMKLEGAELPKESVTAIVRHTDMKRTGRIETSDARLNRLLENAVWGQRSNFADIPSDCPQRDERLGWTGDINAFCRTAAFNYDIRGIMRKWLADARSDQKETGEMPFAVPNVLNDFGTEAMWADCIAMVPQTLYEMYGDPCFLTENYDAIKKFIAARERNMTDGLVASGHEFGDWLALDNEQCSDDNPVGRTDVYYITNVLHTNVLRIAEKTAKLMRDEQSEKEFRQKRSALVKKIRREYFTASGRLALDTVTAQVLALYFDIVPAAFRKRLAKTLNENVVRHGYRVVTGFIGTPYLLFALSDNGYHDTACRVLTNRAFPGWLYEVDMGATTVWERWNSLLPDGTPNPNGMNSYNHYAYGSVMEFVYRRIAGIEATEAGFRRVRIAPKPCAGVDMVKAEYESVSGKIEAGYERKGEKIVYRAKIPHEVKAEIVLPSGKIKTLHGGEYSFEFKDCKRI